SLQSSLSGLLRTLKRVGLLSTPLLFRLSPGGGNGYLHDQAIEVSATVSQSSSQTFLGIGGSGAWWPYDLYNFPEPVRQNLSALLFSPDGLGLTNYRWNVGSGGVDVDNPTRAIETFYRVGAGDGAGRYDWSADRQGVYFLRKAAEHGVPSLTAFVNSAPAPLTSTGGSCGGAFVNGTGAEFAAFLADVIVHWREDGIPINFVSPMNEPD
ncbi:unnamed protein product, partial [Mycena citricolor]